MNVKHNIISVVVMIAIFFGTVGPAAGFKTAVVRSSLKLIDETIEVAMRVSGRSLGPAGRRTAAQQLRETVLKYGDDALISARRGGLELMEAANRHGDDVWKFAHKVPEATRVLATRADELVPAVRRLGVDVLRLEAKNPGLSSSVAREFGDDAVRYFGHNVPARDATRLVGYARKANSVATRRALLESYRKKGTVFLEHLNWKQIMTYGLSTAVIISAYQVSDGMQNGLKTVAQESPDAFEYMGRELIRPFTVPICIFGCGVAGILLFRFKRNNRWFIKRESTHSQR